MASSNRFQNALPLKTFIQRAQVKNLYRHLLKASLPCQDNFLKTEIQSHIRQSFKQNKHFSDPIVIKSLISEGNKSLEYIKSLVSSAKPFMEIEERESWLDEKDEIDGPRGRVGVGWPWEENQQDNNSDKKK